MEFVNIVKMQVKSRIDVQ